MEDIAAEPLPLTEASLERHFQDMLAGATVVSVEDLTGDVAIGCVDGRRPHFVTGAPGGSAGLLVILLAAWEEETGRRLADDEVATLFARYLDRFGTFYVHTDRIAHDLLAQALAGTAPDDAAIDDMVVAPPPDLRRRLLDALVRPEHVGCGHLRLLLEQPDAYAVRPGLTRAVLRAFFRALWDGDARIVLEVLEGVHEERGVVRVRSARPGAPARWSPRRDTVPGDAPPLITACPRHGALDLFVFHPDAVAALQTLHAAFLAEEGLLEPGRIAACVDGQARLGDRHLETTLRNLAPGLPIFDVTVDSQDGDAPARVTVTRA